MQIIDRVEISYFRSIYTLYLRNCKDINVITGSNDAGKSNILKALNLFFNNETEPHCEFDFLRDLSRYRETEARSAKGRMTIWIRVTFNNFLGWKSLPEKFSIKRTWNRYENNPVDSVDGDIPASTLGRFLAKLKFHYIPAVRSRDIFSDLLADLHDTLLNDESAGLRQSSDALVADLHRLTDGMSANILERVRINSTIDLPESLADLFRALNFITKFGEHEIPLLLRGDGIQSRHLPFILSYISEKSDKHHIWGYEEPENSLELSKSFEMAKDFHEKFATSNQIFMTTHSPAFYDLTGDQVAKWHAESVEENEIRSTHVTSIKSTHELDATLGLINVITPRIREVYDESRKLSASLEEMSRIARDADTPIVYVEGPSDAKILTKAKDVIFGNEINLKFFPANGAGEVTQFLKVSARLKHDDRPLIGLFDCDARGKKEFDYFKNYHLVGNTGYREIDRSKKIYAGMLSLPDHLEDAFEPIDQPAPCPVEFMFDRSVIFKAIGEGKINLKPKFSRVGNEEIPLRVRIDEILKDQGVNENFLYLGMEIDSSLKVGFADWVCEQEDAIFEPFRRTLEALQTVISQ